MRSPYNIKAWEAALFFIIFATTCNYGQVEANIERDMQPENSWNANDSPDPHSSLGKRIKLQYRKLLPLNPLL